MIVDDVVLLIAEDGTEVVAVPEQEGQDVACEGCVFDAHERCGPHAGQHLIGVCTEGFVFVSPEEG
jgi:hypothetical protein